MIPNGDVRRRPSVLVAGCVVVLLGALASWNLYAGSDAVRRGAGRESPRNHVKAEPVAGIQSSLRTPFAFARSVVDPTTRSNGRKPKVLIDPDGRGGVVGAQDGAAGFVLYRPGKPPAVIDRHVGKSEDAQSADVNGDGAPDIVVGGLDGVTYVLQNPRPSACADVYRCRWSRSVIDDDGAHPSHDVIVGDVDRDGTIDVATESGIYFHRRAQGGWLFAGRDRIARDAEGTSLADLSGDGIPDVVAPYRSGTILARFLNPLHRGGDPAREAWAVEPVDPHPPFTGNMTTAVADVNRDGRNDVILAPMYGGGGLFWYENPGRAGIWRRHAIDRTVNFVHQGSLQIADFIGDGHPGIAFAEQDQSPTRRVGIYYNVDGDGTRWRLQVLSTDGGHNIKVGRLGPDHRLALVSARHGYFGGRNPLVVWIDLAQRAALAAGF